MAIPDLRAGAVKQWYNSGGLNYLRNILIVTLIREYAAFYKDTHEIQLHF